MKAKILVLTLIINLSLPVALTSAIISDTGVAPIDSQLQPARRGEVFQLTATLPAPQKQLNPDGLTGCAEMTYYRQKVGLPNIFDSLGYRESNCRNDVRTFCCYGYLQVYISLWLSPKSTYREGLINICGIHSVTDMFGLSDEQKLASMCAVKIAYDIDGLTPWKT